MIKVFKNIEVKIKNLPEPKTLMAKVKNSALYPNGFAYFQSKWPKCPYAC